MTDQGEMVILMEEAYRRVNKGERMLDQYRPGWYNRIDLGSLNMAHGTFCVLGQIGRHREFDDEVWRLMDAIGQTQRGEDGEFPANTVRNFAVEHGFMEGTSYLPPEGDRKYIMAVHISYDRLQSAWAEVILDRQKADRQVPEVPIRKEEAPAVTIRKDEPVTA